MISLPIMIMLLGLLLFLLLLPFALLLASGVFVRFRRDLDASIARLDGASSLIETANGPIEYAEAGSGSPVLFIHGAGGGFDQGLDMAEPIAAAGFRLIAMSRFGYLRTPLPQDASPEAQADAQAALMDALGIEKAAVVAGSAGAPSAMQFAIRHKARCRALVLVVPIAFAPHAGMRAAPPRLSPLAEKILLGLVGSDFAYWLAARIAPKAIVKRVLGTPPRLFATASADERARLIRIMEKILPIRPRLQGILNDAKICAAIPRYPLEAISAPTLIASLRDDAYRTFDGAAYSASQIPGATFIGYDEGGHLWIGHQAELMGAIVQFLKKASA